MGDVQPEDVQEKAGAYTPVPGGVGPLTIAMLMSNTVQAARLRRGIHSAHGRPRNSIGALAFMPAPSHLNSMSDSGNYFGLTGGIACGKSTVAAMFSELGARIIDADKVGHEILLSSSPAFPEIVAAFGRGYPRRRRRN